MSERFAKDRDEAVAAAEVGDFLTAARLFRVALSAAAECGGAGRGAAVAADVAGLGLAPAASILPLPPKLLPPRLSDVAAAHDMLSQCLMELAGGGGDGGRDGGTGADVSDSKSCNMGAAALASGFASQEAEEEALWREALLHAAEATSLQPQWPPGLLTYGRCLRNVGLLDEALRALNAAAQLLKPCGTSAKVENVPARGCAHRRHSHHHHQPQNPDSPASDPGCNTEGRPESPPIPDPQLAAEVAQELEEVSDLWGQQLARDVGLRGLKMRQDAGAFGSGPGRRVWECGMLLAAFLTTAQHGGGTWAQQLSGACMLELGCGTGLAGIAAAAACGARCALTDLPPQLQVTAECATANAGLVRSGGGAVAVGPLDWADTDGADTEAAAEWLLRGGGRWAAALEPDRACPAAAVEEQEKAEGDYVGGPGARCGGGSCSWLLGADLVYSAAQVGPLVGLLTALRRAAQGLDVRAAVTQGQTGLPMQTNGSAEGAAVLSLPLRAPRHPSLGQPALAATRSCRLLLAHKHRSEGVSQRLFGALQVAGIRLCEVGVRDLGSHSARDAAGAGGADGGERPHGGKGEAVIRLRALAASMPSVVLYAGELW